ncbi:MAG: outer membrane beta-barrel protein, partial [Bacteroidales bacterium]|nr:outer membrane beta-barrel protein [Bacteroidales bacterium]
EAAESATAAEAAPAAAKPAERKPREEQRAPEAVKPLWESAYADFAEPAKAARRASLDLKGMLGSNDKVSGNFNLFNGYYAAPEKSPTPKQGISEASESIYGIPVTFGLGVRFPLAGRFSIGTGLDYSFLTRTFTGSFVDAAGAVKPGLELVNNLYYIGIPVNLYYNIVDSGRLRLYGFAGGEVEKGVASSFRARNADFVYRESVPGLQWSVDAGLCVQYMILDRVGVFFDPSARYYFDCGQPKSVRTQKPFLFNLEAGFRFDL